MLKSLLSVAILRWMRRAGPVLRSISFTIICGSRDSRLSPSTSCEDRRERGREGEREGGGKEREHRLYITLGAHAQRGLQYLVCCL